MQVSTPSSPSPSPSPTPSHWVAGAWRGAASGRAFHVRLADGVSLEVPRASAPDLEEALTALAALEPAWSALGDADRRRALTRAAEAFARDPDPADRFRRRLGLATEELRHLAERLEDELVGGLRAGPRAVLGPDFAARRGAVVVRRDWTELWAGTAREVLALLALGRSVVLLSDPIAPMLGEALVRALVAALGPGVPVALLHEDGHACLQHALRDRRASGLSVSAPSARLREVGRWLNENTGSAGAGFGAGLDEAPVAERALRVLRNTSLIVPRGADVEPLAEAAVAAAFGRVEALSGQAPGALGRVLCHERAFSRFTSALLAALARSADVQHPLPLLDRGLVEHRRRAYELGLDEGATPIFAREDARPPAAAEPGSPASAVDPAAVVFTNVEEHMRLAWLGRPAPLLCLLRVESDARAAELAAELDRDPLAEDLSGPGLPGGKAAGPAVEGADAAPVAEPPGPMRGPARAGTADGDAHANEP